MGIDPGSVVTGYGVVDSDGAHSLYVASGALPVKADALSLRLKRIFEGIGAVIFEYQPEAVAIEEVFMSRNAASALKLGQARGAAIAAAATQGLPVAEYAPRHIKQALVGRGAADKQQVQHMVKILLNYQHTLQADEADALAVALTHAHIGATLARVSQADRVAARRRRRR